MDDGHVVGQGEAFALAWKKEMGFKLRKKVYIFPAFGWENKNTGVWKSFILSWRGEMDGWMSEKNVDYVEE